MLNTHTRYLHEGDRALRRGAARDAAGRARARDVHLHRVGGRRPRAADREEAHRRHGRDRDAQRVPRRHDRDRRDLAVARRARRARPPGCAGSPAPDAYRVDWAAPGSPTWGSGSPRRCRRRSTTSRAHGIRFAAFVRRLGLRLRRRARRPAPASSRRCATSSRRAGGVYLADEVQPGFGRTGDTMWGFERHGSESDRRSCPTSSRSASRWATACPIAATIMTPEVVERVRPRHALLQHLRRQRGRDRRRAGHARRRPRRGAAGERARRRRAPAGVAARRSPPATLQSATCAAPGCSSASSSSAPTAYAEARTSRSHVVNGLRDRHVLRRHRRLHNNVLKVRPPLVLLARRRRPLRHRARRRPRRARRLSGTRRRGPAATPGGRWGGSGRASAGSTSCCGRAGS